MKSKKVSNAVRRMPALSHHRDKSEPFSNEKSEVMTWLVSQPEVRQWVMDHCREAGLIRFHAGTGLWHGIDT